MSVVRNAVINFGNKYFRNLKRKSRYLEKHDFPVLEMQLKHHLITSKCTLLFLFSLRSWLTPSTPCVLWLCDGACINCHYNAFSTLP